MQVVAGYEEPLVERIENQVPLKNQIFCYYSNEKIKVYERFAHMFVGKLLREEIINGWRKAGHFIVSQTGTGKSTLIIEEVTKIAVERGKRVLLVVPRTALAMQYKREFAERYCPGRLEELSNAGIKKESHWGPADIFLMQNLINANLREILVRNRKNYDFLVIDEVHAFVGDAAFNPYTEDILRFLIQEVGRDLKRLYLTATPEIVLQEVVNLEAGVQNRERPGVSRIGLPKDDIWMTLYRFKADYQYAQPFFFEKEDELKMLFQDLPDDEKALIFVRSKVQGVRLREELGREKAVYLDANNKMDDEEMTFFEILEKHKFKQKFLIVTKFLDVGINLKDFAIKTVVLFSHYREEIVQMLGRKRMTQNNETLQIYIRVPTCQEIAKELEQLETEQIEMRRCEYIFQNRFTGFFNELPKPLFITSEDGTMQCKSNPFSYALNQYHIQDLKAFMAGGTERNFYENFIRIILSWLPGHQEPRKCKTNKPVIEPLQEEIHAILEPRVGTELDREGLLVLYKQLMEVLKIERRGDQKDQLPVHILRQKFVELKIPFSFKNMSKNGKKGVWTILRGYWE